MRRTTAGGPGTVRWRVRLQPYDSLRYGGRRETLEPVTVLGGGAQRVAGWISRVGEQELLAAGDGVERE